MAQAKKPIAGRILNPTLNRLTIRLARAGRGPFSLVRHVGRKSGKAYETPIIARAVTGGFMIELTYGPNVDWYRNIVAADGCALVYDGVEYEIHGVEPVNRAVGIAAFAPYQRTVLTILRRTHFVFLHEATVGG